MAKYINQNPGGMLTAVEFTPVPDGNFTFIHSTPEKAEQLKQWLTSPEIGQEIVAQTKVEGEIVFVTHGDKNNDALMKAFADAGDKLEEPKPKKEFNAWKWRGNFSNIGQSLNLISAYRKPGGIDAPKLAFAGLNFAASFVNATFGGQKSEDEHRLRHLKGDINRLLGKELPSGCALPSVDDDRSSLREEAAPPKTAGDKFNDLMRENSVRIGEIGLRYLGSIAMAFPVKNWGAAYAHLRKGDVGGAFQTARNKDSTNFYTGVTYLTGKTIGLFSKVPDPYNPAPHTFVDDVREKYLFRLSSAVETGAATVLAVGNFRADKNGKRDFIGAAGGASLMAGLVTRLFAKFGTKEVDMDELYAHSTDILAKATPDKLPQLLAECAATIKENFKDKSIGYGEIYTRMMGDLYRYHHIALDNLGTEPDERLAKIEQTGLLMHTPHAEAPVASLKSSALRPAAHPASFADRVQSGAPASLALK